MAPATAEMVEFVSPHASLWVSIETAHDEYTGPMGSRRTITPARKVQFVKGRAQVDADTADEMRAHGGYGTRFWAAEDIMAPFVGDRDPKVTTGQANSVSHKASGPPLANWDSIPAGQLKEAIASGKIRDLAAALVWEAEHRGRGQVVMAITKALSGSDPTDDDDTLPPAAEVASDGFVQSVPADARGLS